MPAIASRVFLGVAPSVGVAALRKRARQLSSATVAKAVMASRACPSSRASWSGAIDRVQYHFAPPAGRGIHQVRNVSGSDPQPERIPGDRFSVDESRGSERRGHGRELIDRDLGRWLAAKHRQQHNGRIVAAALVDCGFAAFGIQIQDDIFARSLFGTKLKSPINVRSCLRQLLGLALAAHSVTVDLASGPPPAWTCPSIRTAAAAGPDAKPSNPSVNSKALICTLLSSSIFAFRIRELSMN
jgi:hypothetical protein